LQMTSLHACFAHASAPLAWLAVGLLAPAPITAEQLPQIYVQWAEVGMKTCMFVCSLLVMC